MGRGYSTVTTALGPWVGAILRLLQARAMGRGYSMVTTGLGPWVGAILWLLQG